MPYRRQLTQTKLLLIAAIATNPGSTTSQLARLAGIHQGIVFRILPELEVKNYIYATAKIAPKKVTKYWYVTDIGLSLL